MITDEDLVRAAEALEREASLATRLCEELQRSGGDFPFLQRRRACYTLNSHATDNNIWP